MLKRFSYFITLVILIFIWFFNFSSPFMPATKLAHGHVVFDKLSYEETAIGNYNFDCAGFIADCSFKEGVRFELTFEGYTFNKPVYLLMSL